MDSFKQQSTTKNNPNSNNSKDNKHNDVNSMYCSLLSVSTQSLLKINKNNVHFPKNACNDDSDYDYDDDIKTDDYNDNDDDVEMAMTSISDIDYKMATKSLRNLNCKNNICCNVSLISLPLNLQISILQFVSISDKFYFCRFCCKYWYHLLTWHQNIPSKPLQFLFPQNCQYILSSPFINKISRGNHAMILCSLGLGIYINNNFHSMIDTKTRQKHDNKGIMSFDKIQLRHNKKELKSKDLKAISKFLTVNTNVNVIDLTDCKLNDFLLELLCYGIKHNRSVQHLMLSKNKITRNGCKYIGYCLQFNHSLETLWIRSNNIQNDGLKWIAHGLHFNHTLKKISFDNNNITNPTFKFYQALLSEIIPLSPSNNSNYNISDLMNKLASNIRNITSLSSLSLLSIKKSVSRSSDDDNDDNDDNDNDIDIDIDDNMEYLNRSSSSTLCELLFSIERICAFNVSQIKLTQNERNTQSYIGYDYNNNTKTNEMEDEFINSIDGFLMMAHLFGRNKECGLQTVSFRDNNISSIALTLLSKSLIYNANLKELHLSYNNIDETGVFAIFSLLQYYQKYKQHIQRIYGLDVYLKSGNKLNDTSTLWSDIEQLYNQSGRDNDDDNKYTAFGHIY